MPARDVSIDLLGQRVDDVAADAAGDESEVKLINRMINTDLCVYSGEKLIHIWTH